MRYCVVLIIPNYHLQLCGDKGLQMTSYEEARSHALYLQSNYPEHYYSVYLWEDFLQSKDALEFLPELREPCGVAHEQEILKDVLKGL